MVSALAYTTVVFASLAGVLGATPPRRANGREQVRNVAIIGMLNYFLVFLRRCTSRPLLVGIIGDGAGM